MQQDESVRFGRLPTPSTPIFADDLSRVGLVEEGNQIAIHLQEKLNLCPQLIETL